jgi:Vitamin K-dependent gamma-carboxylase
MNSRSSNMVRNWWDEFSLAWDQFWFAPRLPHTLAVIRIACGAMLVYVHVIWAIFATDFMGSTAWIDNATIEQLHTGDWAWSWLWYIESPALLVLHECLAILFSAAMTVGFASRIAMPLAWLFTLMTCHRMTGALFGLDQVVVMLCMYLMLAPCGSVFSIDAQRPARAWAGGTRQAGVWNNIATRLIQLHLCVIYIFGGLSKMRGEMWFDGSAMWWTLVNYEYQSLDMTWLGQYPFIITSLTAFTIFWETFYCALVWPRLTRPFALAAALFVHGGIAFVLGMVTFGFSMIIANCAFIEPEFIQRLLARFSPTRDRMQNS